MDQDMQKQAAIIGFGLMGCDIAAIFLAGGWRVTAVEPDRASWPARMDRVAASLAQLGAGEGHYRGAGSGGGARGCRLRRRGGGGGGGAGAAGDEAGGLRRARHAGAGGRADRQQCLGLPHHRYQRGLRDAGADGEPALLPPRASGPGRRGGAGRAYRPGRLRPAGGDHGEPGPGRHPGGAGRAGLPRQPHPACDGAGGLQRDRRGAGEPGGCGQGGPLYLRHAADGGGADPAEGAGRARDAACRGDDDLPQPERRGMRPGRRCGAWWPRASSAPRPARAFGRGRPKARRRPRRSTKRCCWPPWLCFGKKNS